MYWSSSSMTGDSALEAAGVLDSATTWKASLTTSPPTSKILIF